VSAVTASFSKLIVGVWAFWLVGSALLGPSGAQNAAEYKLTAVQMHTQPAVNTKYNNEGKKKQQCARNFINCN